VNVSEAVSSRRSIRAFLNKPVDKDVLARVLEKARNAPSGGNVQPWNAVVVTGDPLANLIGAVMTNMMSRKSDPEYDIYPPSLPEPYRTRRFGSGEIMFNALGIAREDKAARMGATMNNFNGFGAPVLLLCHTPAYMGKPQWSDLGMWLQTIMLLLREEGLDSCAQEAWSAQGKTVKAQVGIPEDHAFFCGIAIGYRDPAAPVNNYENQRATLEETVVFQGF
jgi:nitroreductase